MNKSDKLKVQCREFDQPVFIEIKERVIKVEEILESWHDTGCWWEGESEKVFYRLYCQDGGIRRYSRTSLPANGFYIGYMTEGACPRGTRSALEAKRMDFVSLHSHSPFSFLDGASRIEELVNRAAELDMPALAITDHDNLCGAVKFYKGARKAGIKPIQGVEITMEGGFHLTLLARSPRAYASLCSLLTRSHLDNPRGEPAAAFTGLKELKEVIVLSGCRQGEINQLILQGQYKKACRRAREYLGILGRENFYIELQGGCLPGDSFINRRLYQLAQDLDIEMVASNNVHYACHQDFIIHDLLTCIRTLTRVQDIHPRRPLNGENYLKPTPEMKKLFAGYPKAVENTRRIAEECQRVFEDNQVHLPAYSERKGETSGQMLKRLVFEGARRRYGRINGRVRERLDRKLR